MDNIDNITKEELAAFIEHEIDFEKLSELCGHITDAINEILDSCGMYFRIFSRVKSPGSIASKLIRGKYGSAGNPKKMQDLLGLRVVLYYYDDLSICRDIMESTFQMVDTWSRNTFNSDEFRATKINGVFRFPAEYFKLYKKKHWTLPIDTTFEIQFRTVFFEGWHEIEHDMRYKSLLSDDQFWKGSEELSRMLNCILANLELSDWSLVQLFDQLSYNHYKTGNWELMLKSKFRIKIDASEKLHPDIKEFIQNPARTLPIIVIMQRNNASDGSYTENSFKDGYDMNTFYVNGTRLAKVIGSYSHVYMADRCFSENFAQDNNIAPSVSDGCTCIFWPAKSRKGPEIFTHDMICDTQFDFNRLIFHDENITEKAFRHKLVQIIKDDNVSH